MKWRKQFYLLCHQKNPKILILAIKLTKNAKDLKTTKEEMDIKNNQTLLKDIKTQINTNKWEDIVFND